MRHDTQNQAHPKHKSDQLINLSAQYYRRHIFLHRGTTLFYLPQNLRNASLIIYYELLDNTQ
jgi:hypothetical protein